MVRLDCRSISCSLPEKVINRLERISEDTQQPKSRIMKRGIIAELDKLEADNPQKPE